ncbi:hydrogen peroxide-inducible genes activator [Lutimaribacter marinistellae]|uniref:Hydrogen peroxide-inducible genes activator n=1 Tax=Lutimaribacter marinistellae TaxID=1820329 RepID=A0ABV7TH55_9RHOB
MPDLTLRQIRYFSALSETLQYQRAARLLGISQPSLSLQIAALEETLGTRLIERRRTGLILTPEGREIAEQSRRILREVEALKLLARPMQTDMSGTLRLGSTPTIGPYLMPRVLRRVHGEYPDLKLIIRDGAPQDLAEELAGGHHDVILTQLPVRHDELRTMPLFREELRLAVSQGHRLADRTVVQNNDLSDETLLSLGPAYQLHRQVADICATSGATRNEAFEGTSLDALRQMVSLGMGVTLLPALYIRSEVAQPDPDVETIRFRPALHRLIGLAWRATSGNPPAFVRLADIIRDVARKEFPETVIPMPQ